MSKVRSIPSFATLLQDFFVERLMEQRAVSQETISSYRDTFRLFLKFASDRVRESPSDLTLADLDAPLVLAFLKHLEIDRHNSARTRNVRLAGLRSFMKYAAYRDIASLAVIQRVLAVPMKRCDKPLVGFLSREEVQQLLVAPDPDTWTGQRDRVLLATIHNTGARVSEILALRVGATLIKRWLPRIPDAPSQRLFPNRSGNAMTRSNVADRLRIAIKRAKEQCPQLKKRRVTLHMVRHTTATHLLQSGADLSVIAGAERHSAATCKEESISTAGSTLAVPGVVVIMRSSPDHKSSWNSPATAGAIAVDDGLHIFCNCA